MSLRFTTVVCIGILRYRSHFVVQAGLDLKLINCESLTLVLACPISSYKLN